MKRYLYSLLLLLIPLFALCKATEELVKSMVPHGQISRKIGQDYHVKTVAGTKITLEFDQSGNLDEASGLNLGKGDVFEPGQGLMALDSVAKTLQIKGHQISGEWKLEKDDKLGWVYELTGLHSQEGLGYLVNAKNSELLRLNE
jgi:hypothetical protein